jgi:hypothetical protein
MIVATRASSSSSGGNIPGTVRARRVLPEPGGPIITMQWPPARASSIARRASSWPRTSARSGHDSAAGALIAWSEADVTPAKPALSEASSTRGGIPRARPRRLSRRTVAASARVAAPTTSIPPARILRASLASARPSSGTTTRPTRRRTSAETMGSSPGTARSSPPSESSPITAHRPLAVTCSDPTRTPRAIARSSDAPLLRNSAGARLTVMRRGGYS